MSDAATMETENLPPLYQRWVESLLPHGIPREHVATCLDCVMCAKSPEEAAAGYGFFNPKTKCCTYHPNVPNYLAGRALDVDSPGGRVFHSFVASDTSDPMKVTLFGVSPNAKAALLYDADGKQGFGHDDDLLCPYVIGVDSPEGPMCGIWQHRNAVCSTYFCKHVRGGTGRQFWMSIRNLLRSAETALSWWAIAELIPDIGARLLHPPSRPGERLGLELPANAWSFWPGSRADFFRACADRVEALSWEEVVSIAGIDMAIARDEVVANHARLISPDIPDRLRPATYRVIEAHGDRTMVQTDAGREYFELPSVLLPLLRYFDGRPSEEVLAHIQAEERIELDLGLVRKLYDFGMLHEACG